MPKQITMDGFVECDRCEGDTVSLIEPFDRDTPVACTGCGVPRGTLGALKADTRKAFLEAAREGFANLTGQGRGKLN